MIAHKPKEPSSTHAAPPCTIVIFGAAGDLTKRKLIPALYNLRESQLLPDNFAVIGLARAEMNDEEFRRRLSDNMREFATDSVDPKIWHWVEERLFYLSGDITADGIELGSYGVRECEFVRWIYGTGLAEPRFSTLLKTQEKNE